MFEWWFWVYVVQMLFIVCYVDNYCILGQILKNFNDMYFWLFNDDDERLKLFFILSDKYIIEKFQFGVN